MEIKPFKMRVTPEQSKIVQQTLFDNGYRWASEAEKNINYLNKPYLYWENLLRYGSDKYNFIEDYLPELTFREFFDTYVKWCIRGSKELAHWERTAMKGACDVFLNHPDYYYVPESDNLLFWNAWRKVPENHIELTFEQFKQYVLKTKDMEKKIIGYKLREDCKQYEEAVLIISTISRESFYSLIPKVGYNFGNSSELYFRFKEAGVLDLWFTPVYKETSKELYFGKVKFTINKGDNFATTEYGKVTKKEIETAINYIENPPKLNNYFLSIKALNNSEKRFDELDGTYLTYAFGCQAGSLKELKEIYNAFE